MANRFSNITNRNMEKRITNMSSNNKNYGGTGFLPLLTILFIGLKLTGYIAWSWWWVLSPILIPLGIAAIAGIIAIIIYRIAK